MNNSLFYRNNCTVHLNSLLYTFIFVPGAIISIHRIHKMPTLKEVTCQHVHATLVQGLVRWCHPFRAI
jgi:hypothetical protein